MIVFIVQRREPELVAPAKPTPHEFKYLSNIDDQVTNSFYRNEPAMSGQDPVKVIRKAIAETLVFYYPFAGRLKKGPGQKLVVDCTGEGIISSVMHALHPPFPCLDELLYDVPGSSAILGCPLLLIQVTRLMCGGFIFALRLNHTMSDAIGLVQFMSAVSEIARGAQVPSVSPVWERELLHPRNPPRVTILHGQNAEMPNTKGTLIPHDNRKRSSAALVRSRHDLAHWKCIGHVSRWTSNGQDQVYHTQVQQTIPVSHDNMVLRSFFFRTTDVAALWKHVPPHLRTCSTFDVLTTCLWRCCTIAIGPNPEEDVLLICIVNARAKFQQPLPVGYYGNLIAFSVAISSAAKLCKNPIGYALELVKKAKAVVTEEYMRSLVDLLVFKGSPSITTVKTFGISDLRHAGFREVDFGWGQAMYGGPALGKEGNCYISFRNHKGEDGIVVPFYLTGPAMERLEKEIKSMIKDPPVDGFENTNTTFKRSNM
ncbi:hypothetical protein NE237_030841 [Protea cynaroides]|uniref:Benzyl alcohol O-benzoyltransferase n=1 Tax=Protea cynaroides TaxID=273540 RepID=A0A9Q0GYM8_9MAGN|nr:hypothetical protein NE237_030841 [Protea cynaroides]